MSSLEGALILVFVLALGASGLQTLIFNFLIND